MHNQPYQSNYSHYQIPPPPYIAPAGHEQEIAERAAPLRCNICGERREVTLRSIKKDYVPFVAYFSLLLGVLIGLLVLLLLRVQHKLNLPFCDRCWRRSRTSDIVAGVSVGAFFVSIIVGVAVMLNLNSGFGFLVPTLPAAVFLFWAMFYKRKNNPRFKKVDRKQVVVSTASGEIIFAK
jgi:hypothetical protein